MVKLIKNQLSSKAISVAMFTKKPLVENEGFISYNYEQNLSFPGNE